ncbi:5'/3'-nucleotidase SurE [Rudanella paleaurantiibacter]|uniref:5'-nucleotidase SurE n=1 Tax=Rudanella paleaurantiibacter TaxID=2614655 RepID=A0A7J5TUV2_9BACT|nr:5'/3'-nucleotidase SurE [Rudanella paleaurantiibacter]KAB7727929.1 5'/3'-nucleotidase SurE [Rudanella paleaurantiibacter]
MAHQKPLILVTNDDGITAHGIRTLVEVMQELGTVIVVAPNSPQSGMGHAITIANPLRLYPADIFGEVIAYECSGTPADCVKLAKHHILKDRSPDLVVSGINHGYNTSISVLYSGTMSAAIEAAIEGIPAIGFSLGDFSRQPDFSHVREHVFNIAQNVLQNGLTKGVALNVNFPARGPEPLRGVRVCRQANAKWEESFHERRDPHGRRYFWLDGEFVNYDAHAEDTDEYAVANNYVSVVPCQYDLTAYSTVEQIQQWGL